MTALATWKHRGTLYADDNSTAEATTDATPRKVVALDTAGVEAGLNVDAANNQIVIAAAGDYMVTALGISFLGSAAKTFYCEIYLDATGTGHEFERMLGAGGDVGAGSCGGLVTCAVGETLSLYHSSSDGGSAFTLSHGQLTAIRVS